MGLLIAAALALAMVEPVAAEGHQLVGNSQFF